MYLSKTIILHIDMDYFFAQIEERENPHFKGKPIVVGADPKRGKGRGVVSTCNYLARKHGIKSGMPISKAFELCSQAIFLPVDIELYKKVSEKIMEIVKKYSKKYEIVSLDEAYLDISLCKSYKKAKELAKNLKKEIFEKEKLTCTIGIGPNKTIAKLATNSAKPNGLRVVKPKEVEKFLDPLDIKELPGIGPKTAEKLRKIGVNKIFELKKLPKQKLKEMFGKGGEKIWEKTRGIDREPVAQRETIKSLGRQITFERDTKNPELIFESFDRLIREVYDEIISKNFFFKTITVICRYKDFETHTKSKTLKEPSKDFNILKKESKKLLLKFLLESKKPIRLIGIRIKIE
jgi:DNA polymerase IV (DinB-like DNA polymerase)